MKHFTDLTLDNSVSAWCIQLQPCLQEIQTSFVERLCACSSELTYNYDTFDYGQFHHIFDYIWGKPITDCKINIPSGVNIQNSGIYQLELSSVALVDGSFFDYAGLQFIQRALVDGIGMINPLWYYYSPLDLSVSGLDLGGGDVLTQDYRYTWEKYFNSLYAKKRDGTMQKWRGFRRVTGEIYPTDWTDVNDSIYETFYPADTADYNFFYTGIIQEGDIFGPWIIDDLQILISNMKDLVFSDNFTNGGTLTAIDTYTMFSESFGSFTAGVWYAGAYNFKTTSQNSNYYQAWTDNSYNIQQVTRGKLHMYNIPSHVPYKLKTYQQADKRGAAVDSYYDPYGYITQRRYTTLMDESDWRTGSTYTLPTYYGDEGGADVGTSMASVQKGSYFGPYWTIVFKNNNFTYGNILTSVEFPNPS